MVLQVWAGLQGAGLISSPSSNPKGERVNWKGGAQPEGRAHSGTPSARLSGACGAAPQWGGHRCARLDGGASPTGSKAKRGRWSPDQGHIQGTAAHHTERAPLSCQASRARARHGHKGTRRPLWGRQHVCSAGESEDRLGSWGAWPAVCKGVWHPWAPPAAAEAAHQAAEQGRPSASARRQ